jgi:hypothetical protein
MAGSVAPRDPLSNVAEFVEKNKVSEKCNFTLIYKHIYFLLVKTPSCLLKNRG